MQRMRGSGQATRFGLRSHWVAEGWMVKAAGSLLEGRAGKTKAKVVEWMRG